MDINMQKKTLISVLATQVAILENVMGLAKYVSRIVALIERNVSGYLD
jgi:hypothetical protein